MQCKCEIIANITTKLQHHALTLKQISETNAISSINSLNGIRKEKAKYTINTPKNNK